MTDGRPIMNNSSRYNCGNWKGNSDKVISVKSESTIVKNVFIKKSEDDC